MRRYELTDAQWEQIAPLLPPQKPRTGRPAEDHRQVLNGMLWILRTGAPWADLPARYGPVGTVSSRFYRWRQAGRAVLWVTAVLFVSVGGGLLRDAFTSPIREVFPTVLGFVLVLTGATIYWHVLRYHVE